MCFFVPVQTPLAHLHWSSRPRGRAQDRHQLTFWTALSFVLLGALTGSAADWQDNLTRNPPSFPPLRSLRATYIFGWSGFTAATSEAHFTKTAQNRFQLDGTGRTVGLSRALYKLDVEGWAVTDADTLRPIELKQTEVYRSTTTTTHLVFKDNKVTSERTEGNTTKNREFTFPGLYELLSAMLYLRSQPLQDSGVCRVVVYPQKGPYLATVTVVGREKISVRAGSYNAIKLDLKINRIGKDMELQNYKKFRRATIWISDDPDRVLLRIEATIFVGTIFCELHSVRFEG